MTASCPSDLKLEHHLLDPALSGVEPHLAACGPCRERLRRMEQEGQEFHERVFPATVGAVMEAARRRPRRAFALVPVIAAAAAVILLVRIPFSPAPDHVGLKGDALGLTVFAGGPDGARALTDRAQVPAAAALRFQVRPSAPCHLWIVSVDAAGQVSRLYPATGDGGDLVTGAGALPGGAVLDGLRGPERIYAVCSPQPLALEAVRSECRRAAGTGDEALRRAGALRSLPAGAFQSTLLLEKRP